MKKLIVLMFSAGCLYASTQEAKSTTTDKPVLTGQRAAYAAQYMTLRKSLLGKTGDEMGTTEALEAVAVEFSLAIEKADARITQLERRAKALEEENKQTKKWQADAEAFIDKLDKRVKALEDRVAVVEGDQDKLFNWARDTDDELHNGLRIGGIKAKVDSLDKQLNNYWQGLSGRVSGLEATVGNHAAAIRDIANALHSIR